jgi:hypothetical protein
VPISSWTCLGKLAILRKAVRKPLVFARLGKVPDIDS